MSQQPSSTFIGRCLQNAPLPRQKILQALRGAAEGHHRINLNNGNAFRLFHRLEIDDPHLCDNIPAMNIKQADDRCNKTIPIYICHDHRTMQLDQCAWLLGHALHNWLYKMWFRPYRSDIEWGQFIAKIFECIKPFDYYRPGCETKWQGLGDSPEDVIDMTIHLNRVICKRVEAAQKHILELEAPPVTPENRWSQGWVPEQPLCELQRDQSSFILQPLFRALVMVIQVKDFSIDMTDIGGVVVYLVLTGVEDGLSAPIPLRSLKKDPTELIQDRNGNLRAARTTLEIAYHFIRELESREEAAFGLRPDPVEGSKGLRAGYHSTAEGVMGLAYELGWQPEWGPLEYPSSRWVDTNLIRKWEGGGEHWDRMMRREEGFRRKAALEKREKMLKLIKEKEQKEKSQGRK